jgi:hypothetical protein
MSLARQVDPHGLRTIGAKCLILRRIYALTMSLLGVLTKPDTLTTGATRSKELWLDVVEGRDMRFPLRLGYYCTRQPDEDERRAGISNAEARQTESTFFTQTMPWSMSTHRSHFGTQNLVASLSRLLTRIIDDR